VFTVLTDDQSFVGGARSWMASTDYRLATSPDDLWNYADGYLQRGISPAADFEATGLNVWTDKIVGMSLSFEKGHGIYAPCRHFEGAEYNIPVPTLVEVIDAIDKRADECWWYHSDFDHEMARNDWRWQPTFGKWRDAMIGVFLEFPDALTHGLKDTAYRLLGCELIEYLEIIGYVKRKGQPIPGFERVHPVDAPSYACADSDFTRRLARLSIVQKAIKDQSLIWDLEHKILPPIRAGIDHGVPTDGIYLTLLSADVRRQLAILEQEVKEALGVPTDFNLRSREKLGDRLEALGVPVAERVTKINPRTGAGFMSTRKATLDLHADRFPFCASLVKYAELGAAERNYIRKAIAARDHFGPKVRIAFNTIGAPTGRMSSGGAGRTQAEAFSKGYANLNGQSWPDPEKKDYLPDVRAGVSVAALDTDEWVIVAIDYEQVELRVLANVSGEEVWAESFRKGIDIHRTTYATAHNVPVATVDKPKRKKGKTLSFAIVYQATPKTVAKQAGIPEAEADRLIKAVLDRCPRLKKWVLATKAHAAAYGFVQTFFGRRRVLKHYFGGDYSTKAARKLKAQGEREGVNAPIQGGAADVFKIAVYKVAKLLQGLRAEEDWIPIMWVHDETVSLVRRSRLYELLPKVVETMEFKVKGWTVPLKVVPEVGWNWGLDDRRNRGAGLLSWGTWCQRYPPETASTPLVCWLPASAYPAPPPAPAPEPEDETLDDLLDEDLDDITDALDGDSG